MISNSYIKYLTSFDFIHFSEKQVLAKATAAVGAVALTTLISKSFLTPTAALYASGLTGVTVGILLPPVILYGVNKAFHSFKESRNSDAVFDKEVILVVNAKEDHNGSLVLQGISQSMKFHLSQNRYQIVYQQASSFEEITNTVVKLKQQNNRIHALFFNTHGWSRGFVLDKAENNHESWSNGVLLTNRNPTSHEIARKKFKECFQHLDEKTVIVLHSCSTGFVNFTGRPSIAQTIAECAPRCLVYAPTQDFIGLSCSINSCTPLEVSFKAPKITPSAVTTIFNMLLYGSSLGRYGQDSTARFRKVLDDTSLSKE